MLSLFGQDGNSNIFVDISDTEVTMSKTVVKSYK